MKKIIKKIREKARAGIKVIAALVAAIGLFILASPASAQVSIPVKIYFLTNSSTFSFSNPTNVITATGTNTIRSNPFQIWRGRGFTFNWAIITTNTTTTNCTYRFQFASIVVVGTNSFTNWSSTPWSVNITPPALTGTNESYGSTNIPPSIVDNVQIGRLLDATNQASHTFGIDPTNTYISVYP